jgi:TetR/AcrR family transcriptional regulator, transcriptional repressor for nem operon
MQETPRKGSDTRERILDVVEAAVLEKGFAAIAAVGITKSGFFYHFKDKNELAKALLVRYVEREDALFDELFARADELNEDPLHGFLVGLKMMSELMADLPNGHPGCLVASYCYQDRLFDREVRDLNASAVLNWRKRFRQRLDLIAERYPPRVEIDLCRHALRHRRRRHHPLQDHQGQAGACPADPRHNMKLIAHVIDGHHVDIRPAPVERDWLEATNQRFAYRCLPLNIANAYGWESLRNADFLAMWWGRRH